MEILGKLFGSQARVKVLRLFIMNPQEVFEPKDIRFKSQISNTELTREVSCLSSLGIIRKRTSFRECPQKSNKNGTVKIKKKKIRGWALDKKFFHLDSLSSLLISSKSFEKDTVAKRFRNAGRVKLLIISGMFIHNNTNRVDILIVGDALKKSVISKALKTLESEIGKELQYGIFSTKDFMYRYNYYDKFVRDILDYPHEKLIDKLSIY
jgi:hypothetical protein